MKISEILQTENNNTDSIILNKEGLFWRAYERSAYLFTLYIKEYKINKKFYKNVNSEVVYLGFPQAVLEQILQTANNKIVQKTEKQIVIKKYKFRNEDYISWKASIQLWQSFGTLPKPEDTNIVEKIKNFPVVNKTPIECQQFIIKLQNKIQA